MQNNITFAIIKPNAVSAGKTGPILSMICEAGFHISAMKMLQMTARQAQEFHLVHKDRPFYDSLVEFMTSGPVVVMILKRSRAVEEFRKLIGATDPARAETGTIRKIFGESVQMNAIHGSDSDENAQRESAFFFPVMERF